MSQILTLNEIDKEVVIQGVTRSDIVEIFQAEFAKHNIPGNMILFFDVSYFMNFHVSDFEKIKKITWATRFDIGVMKDWHRQCERWFMDQTVRDYRGDWFKPIQILRKVDKVPNEGLQEIARAILGADLDGFVYDAIGIGTGGIAYPSDKTLENEKDRIHVINDSPGGSLNRDGSTVYWVGNHLKTIESDDFTECGIFNTKITTKDKMMNHSFFDGYVITHIQGLDNVSRTTSLYMCSA